LYRYIEAELAAAVIDSRPDSPDSTTVNAVQAARKAKKERDGMAEKLVAAESRIRKLQISSGGRRENSSDGISPKSGGGGGDYGDVGNGPASATANMRPTVGPYKLNAVVTHSA
jgi:hypothetical protein